jgi:hypothetical protein
MERSAADCGGLTWTFVAVARRLALPNLFHTQYTDSTQVIPSGSADES